MNFFRRYGWVVGIVVVVILVPSIVFLWRGGSQASTIGMPGPIAKAPAPAICVGTMCSGTPSYLTPAATGGAQDITLIYVEPTAQYSAASDYLPMVAHLSPTGKVLGPFLNSFLFLSIPTPSGGTYANPTNGKTASTMPDWTAFLQTTFQSALPALEQAYTQAQGSFGTKTKAGPLNIFLMTPYPSTTVSVFGSVNGQALDFATEVDREAALRWYAQQVIADWKAAHFTNMRLAGLYWMREDALPYQKTEVTSLANDIHPYGMRLLWIPWKGAEYAGNWASYGFDAAVFQPNFYQNGNTTVGGRPASLSWTANYAQQNHMGMELEVDQSVTYVAGKAGLFYQYLADGASLGYEKNALIAIYQGGEGIARMAHNVSFYWLYNDLYLFTRDQPIPAAPQGVASTSSAS